MSLTGRCEHNCIQIRHWWRTRWVCVRCHRIFNYDATEGRWVRRAGGLRLMSLSGKRDSPTPTDAEVCRALMTTVCPSCGVLPGVPCQFQGSRKPLPDGVHWWRWTAYVKSIEAKEAA